jgi:hypothetical protein
MAFPAVAGVVVQNRKMAFLTLNNVIGIGIADRVPLNDDAFNIFR